MSILTSTHIRDLMWTVERKSAVSCRLWTMTGLHRISKYLFSIVAEAIQTSDHRSHIFCCTSTKLHSKSQREWIQWKVIRLWNCYTVREAFVIH
jgi:hypothetical protein